jgi:hypothetical protein
MIFIVANIFTDLRFLSTRPLSSLGTNKVRLPGAHNTNRSHLITGRTLSCKSRFRRHTKNIEVGGRSASSISAVRREIPSSLLYKRGNVSFGTTAACGAWVLLRLQSIYWSRRF